MKRISCTLLVGIMTLSLASCSGVPLFDSAHRVHVAEEVGDVYVSAYPVVPWSEIGSKLEPKHSLTTTDARAMAAITTQSQVSQFLSTFSAGLGIGLPTKSWSSNTSVDTAGVTTSTSATQRGSGQVPVSSVVTATDIEHDALSADLGRAAATSGIDAATQLMAGTAVFQLAAILDNQLSKGWLPRGYQANLITFQVNLQPARRDLPYDTYITLTLLPGDWTEAVRTSSRLSTDASTFPPVMIYPLVIADAMETSSVAKSVEIMRQAALSLSGIVGNAGVNAGLAGSSDRLNAIVAGDRNSLTTVGRISDQTVRIRIGAQQQGSSKLAMVPRTQNISMVVFTRAADFEDGYLNRLAVVSQVSYADAQTGVVVPDTPRPALLHERQLAVRGLMQRHGIRPVDIDRCGGPANIAGNLMRAAERSEYQYLGRCLAIEPADTASLYRAPLVTTGDVVLPFSIADYGVKVGATTYLPLCSYRGNGPCSEGGTEGGNHATPMPAYVESEFRRFVAGLTKLQATSLEQRMLIPLPFKGETAVLPDSGQVVLLEDDEDGAQVAVRGGTSLRVDKLDARLYIGALPAARFLVPLSVAVVDNGQTVVATFPPLQKYELVKPGEALALHITHDRRDAAQGVECSTGNAARHVLAKSQSTASSSSQATTSGVTDGAKTSRRSPLCADYGLTLVPGEKSSPANPLKVTAGVLVADHAGNGRITVTAGKVTGVLFRIAGGELRSGEPTPQFDAEHNAYKLAPGVVTVLTLGNLSPARTVSLVGLLENKVVGAPIVLPVQMAARDAKP